jgi:hypothetical protein
MITHEEQYLLLKNNEEYRTEQISDTCTEHLSNNYYLTLQFHVVYVRVTLYIRSTRFINLIQL